jgi:hypothetical protein
VAPEKSDTCFYEILFWKGLCFPETCAAVILLAGKLRHTTVRVYVWEFYFSEIVWFLHTKEDGKQRQF